MIFADGTKVTVIGLDEIMAELYSEGRQTDNETVKEIIGRLEAHKNYIPPSDHIRREYAYLLMKKYEEYVEIHDKNRKN
ncbi:MAG TPA: hypothetical protein ENN86_04305 [Desulfobacteraceae bacterium]|nr:hypothetical protein [Desulfobacteraceae bacterium]